MVLFKLTDGRYLLVVWVHKSHYSKHGKVQLASYVYGMARQVLDSGLTEGQMPILCGVYATY